ncbi:MAG: type II secretion system protein GspE [Nitrospirae bacterium]|nr:MAG: type II secretion system protein GspE [Nitrospirota bacterium]
MIRELPKVPLVLNGISSRFLRENRVIPVEIKDGTIEVVMDDPSRSDVIEALEYATGAKILAYQGNQDEITEYIEKFYGKETTINKIIEDIDQLSYEEVTEEEEDIGHLKDLASEAPIIKLVNLIITRAVENRASDIHLEPYEDELKVRYRIDGVLHEVESTPRRLQPAIISRIKIMAKLNIAERRLPQDGKIKLKVSGKDIDMRISTIPVLHGESVVIRLLDRESIVIDLERLGFPEDTLSSFNRLIGLPNGIILVTGPTGSGKTTTLYGALDKINSPEKKIITVEDPIEYQLKGVNQIQVKPQIGLNFANTLRHIVRQDPDIIMIGEIRDLETAEIAIQASLTGHLVFSTLHTNDAPSAITRLIDMGVEGYLLASTLRGILAQRLVRQICPECKEVDHDTLPEERMLLNIPQDITLYRGSGCEHCAGTGFYGRTGIFELLTIDEDLRKLISKDTDSATIRKAARSSGMRTLSEDGAKKVMQGVTTISEVIRVTQEV